jgi:recA bacterial DNA recombination protein
MSSAVVSTSAALGRPFLFDAESEPEVCSFPGAKKPSSTESKIAQVVQSTIKNQQSTIGIRQSAIENAILPASRLGIRPTPEMASSGIPALDALTGGLPRGCLTELCGVASSGRTTVMLAALAAAARRGEYCALIDASDALDPHSVAAAGVDLDHLLWVRCSENSAQSHPSTSLRAGSATENHKINRHGFPPILPDPINNQKSTINNSARYPVLGTRNSLHRLEQVLRATDLLLESGGFGLIVLDLADLPPQATRRIPLTTWFRFRRAVEHKPTILLAIEQQPIAGSCSSLLLHLGIQSVSRQAGNLHPSDFSRKAAVHESPARQYRVDAERKIESRRDETVLSHAHLLTGLEINVELTRSRLERKPTQSVIFETKTAWAG